MQFKNKKSFISEIFFAFVLLNIKLSKYNTITVRALNPYMVSIRPRSKCYRKKKIIFKPSKTFLSVLAAMITYLKSV